MPSTQEFSNELSSLVGVEIELRGSIDRITKARRDLETLLQNDPTPKLFVGVTSSYRFTTGKKKEAPTHRWEVFCRNGLSIHMEVSSLAFEQLMMSMSMGEVTPGKINNKLMLVEREVGYGMIPRKFIEEDYFEFGDRWGNHLWAGASVTGEFEGKATIMDNNAAPSFVSLKLANGEDIVVSVETLELSL